MLAPHCNTLKTLFKNFFMLLMELLFADYQEQLTRTTQILCFKVTLISQSSNLVASVCNYEYLMPYSLAYVH